jgi:hypothetical protein
MFMDGKMKIGFDKNNPGLSKLFCLFRFKESDSPG